MDIKEVIKRLDKIDEKLDKHQEVLWAHINNDTRNFERLEGRVNAVSQEITFFKKITLGVATVLGSVISWVIAIRR